MEEIAYKVVDLKTRRGSNYMIFNFYGDTSWIRFPDLFPAYHDGTKVLAPQPPGIFCFDSLEGCKKFLDVHFALVPSKTLILKVIGTFENPNPSPAIFLGAAGPEGLKRLGRREPVARKRLSIGIAGWEKHIKVFREIEVIEPTKKGNEL